MVRFEIVGKLAGIKASDKFHPFEKKTYESGWENTTLLYNVISGNNRFMMQVRGGHFSDGHGDVYVFSKAYKDDDGNEVKSEAFTIPYKDRFTSPDLERVAEWKKYVFDLEEPGRRYALKNLIEKIKDGSEVTDDELKEVNVTSKEKLEEAYEKSLKKRKEFICQDDYATYINKVIESDKYKDRMFTVRGNYEMQYSEAKDSWYGSFVPNKIYLAAKDAEAKSVGQATLFYSEGAIKESDDMAYINTYIIQYDNNFKTNLFAPYPIVIKKGTDENAEKAYEIRKKRFEVEDDSVYELGVTVQFIDGAETTTLKVEDLPEEVQDAILIGDISERDALQEYGGVAYGERITQTRFSGLMRGYAKGRQETAYKSDDLMNTSLKEDKDSDVFDDDDDLFSDLD